MDFLAVDFQVIRHWVEMSVIMMLPISAAISWRLSLRTKNFVVAQIGFLLAWIFASVPINWLANLQNLVNSNLFIVAIWTGTGIYQFSQLHTHFVNSCMKIESDSGFTQGLRIGADCIRACGPLMISAFLTMPMTAAIMFTLTTFMLLEFISSRGLYLSRAIGLASVLFALGNLFLSTPVQINDSGSHTHHTSGL